MSRTRVQVNDALRARAAHVHANAIVIDGMCPDHIAHPHSTLRFNEPYLQKLVDGGITAFNQSGLAAGTFKGGVKLLRGWHRRVAHNAGRALFVARVEDIEREDGEEGRCDHRDSGSGGHRG